MGKNIEILAPAGSLESLYGALDMGADAVYAGARQFGARAFADNPDTEQLQKALTYAHLRNKKIYLTVNTLLTDRELEEELFPLIAPLYEAGLDACIVQDIGVLSFLCDNFPGMDLHASTQMTLFSGDEAELFKPFGVTRYVPARELTIEEIREEKRQTDLEIEVFVHGALCYCYSGQCLMSQVIGGRSGNRGMCAQPCRLPFHTPYGDGYVLSTKDLCTLTDIPELVDAGIDSFKIEGRMKNKEYSAFVAYLYRKYVDIYEEEGREYFEELKQNKESGLWQDFRRCQDLYNRGGFCRGFLFERDRTQMVCPGKNNHFGTLAGEVTAAGKGRAGFIAREELAYQDVLEFRDENGEAAYEYTVREPMAEGSYVETNVMRGSKIYPGQRVYRTRSNSLYENIRRQMEEARRDYPLRGEFAGRQGSPASLAIEGNGIRVTVEGPEVQRAGKRPVTESEIREKLGGLGNTSYCWEELSVDWEAGSFIPLGGLKSLRREALRQWEEAAVGRRKAQACVKGTDSGREKGGERACSRPELPDRYRIISVSDSGQLRTALDAVTEDVIFHIKLEDFPAESWGQAARWLRGKKMALSFPRILRGAGRRAFEREWQKYGDVFSEAAVYAAVINSFAMYLWAKRLWPGARWIADNNLYMENERAESVYRQFFGIGPSPEILYGRIPVMVSESCVAATLSRCGKGEERIPVRTPKGDEFVVVNHCRYCYNTIYTGEPVRKRVAGCPVRLDFTWEHRDEVREVIREWSF